jgi:uncharacterized protein (TIRG00374 family)
VNAITRNLANLARYLLPCLILGWLFAKLWSDDRDSLFALWDNAGNWPQLLLAVGIYLVAVIGTFVRWYLLVAALHLPFQMRDAIRLGFIGYLLQFVSLGSVGGDLFKAVFLAREQPNRKPEAVATILVDRIVGLFSLSILACLVFAFLQLDDLGDLAPVRSACFAIAGLGAIGFVIAFGTNFSFANLASHFRPWSSVRAVIIRVQSALDLYRSHRGFVLAAVSLGVLTHFLQALAIFMIATAVFPDGPRLSQQVLLLVIAGTVAAIPIAPGGLGTFDLTYKAVYESLAASLTVANEGFLVAILYRVMCVVAATIGVIVFWSCGGDVRSAAKAPHSTSEPVSASARSTQS